MSKKKTNILYIKKCKVGAFRYFKTGHIFIFFNYNDHGQKGLKLEKNHYKF